MLNSQKSLNKWIALVLILGLGFIWSPSQENQMSYLSQKLMLENNLRERVTDALDKLLDDIKFVVDVAIEIEFRDEGKIQTTYETAPEYSAPVSKEVAPTEKQPKPGRGSDLALPLPGFETPEDMVKAEDEAKALGLQEGPPTAAKEASSEALPGYAKESSRKQPVSSSQVKSSAMSIPVVKRQKVNIIMEDGVTPEIIENVRQVVAIASHYDRARGDVISVMTASFKKREDQDAAEAIILKNIAEKIDDLERRQKDAEHVAKIEQQKRLERQAVVRDSLRIQELHRQIQDLQTQLNGPQLSDDQREQTLAMADAREVELGNLKEQLRESNRRLQELEMGSVVTSPPGFIRTENLGLYIILAIFAIALITLLVILLINRRRHQERQEMEWGYGTKVPMGPRPQQPMQQPSAQPAPVSEPRPMTAAPKQAPPVNMEAMKEEMKGIKQSVISMSVGQPDSASRVINDWLGQTNQTEESESEFEGGM